MKLNHKALISIICIAILGVGAATVGIAADTMKITGVINDDGQLVDDSGQVYDISEDEVGSDAMEHSGEKITVDGMVMDEEGAKVIVIKSFKLVE